MPAPSDPAHSESQTKAPTRRARSERELRQYYYACNRLAMGRVAAWRLARTVARHDWKRYG